ncbi:MAG: flagellar basal body-associated FliL family protein [Sideroxyarcus sp.]
MQKPPAKSAPAPAAKEETPVAAPPKSKKMLLIVGAVLLVAVAVGAGWFFGKGSAPSAESAAHEEVVKEAQPALEAKFVPLGENFTVNLQREEGDRYLQAGITLKIMQPELEEKIKATMPEIRSKLLFLLSAKKPSELQTVEGKKKLITEIIAEVDGALGLGSAPAATPAPEAGQAEAAASAPATAPVVEPKTTGVVDVLFTSFIIQ